MAIVNRHREVALSVEHSGEFVGACRVGFGEELRFYFKETCLRRAIAVIDHRVVQRRLEKLRGGLAPDVRWRGTARRCAARNAIHLITLGAGFTGNHQQARFSIVESANAFENRFDGPIDAIARVRENGNVFQKLQPVF